MTQRLLSSTPFSLILRSITFNSQLYGFNSQLYTNLSVAREFPGGVVGVSIMLQVGTPISLTFDFFAESFLGFSVDPTKNYKNFH